ncbi:MAG: hypothetical protein RLZZ238_559 [Planctomycetota bacterium]
MRMYTHNTKARTVQTRARRGVASVLAMLFLVIFGSLAAAMAIVAQGNLRTADSSLKVSRAQSAAESGLVFAQRRLEKQTARFVIAKGVVDPEFAERLWIGSWMGSDGAVTVLPAAGYSAPDSPDGVAAAVRDAHLADASSFAPNAEHQGLPEILQDGTLVTEPIRLEAGNDRLWFQLIYELVPGTSNVRVTSLGNDGDIRRTLSMQFRLGKRIEFAVISPNRIMIGKNVLVEGPLGTRYGTNEGELTPENGDPLVMRSDFRYLSDSLTTKIDNLANAVANFDIDGDGRLRPSHPSESQGLQGLGVTDVDGDQYVDDFDCFLSEYDADGDGNVVWDISRAAAAGIPTSTPEFAGIDDQLARLIDLAKPDRNEDGVVDGRDIRLGWSDGVLNVYDNYAKVQGRLVFGVEESAWESVAGEDWRGIAQGPVRADLNDTPVKFGASPEELRVVTTADFAESASWFSTSVQDNFTQQANAGVSAGGTYTPAASAPYEAVPFGSVAAYDYYRRPIYENMTFRDVRIPKGTNALFRNCRFEGTVYIETETGCTDVNWNYTGALKQVTSGGSTTYELAFPGIESQLGGQTLTDTRTISNSIRFDGCTFLGSIAGDTPGEYTHWRNKVQITGATRFYADPEDPELALQPDGAELAAILESFGTDKLDMLQRSSIMMPGWSIDVGNFSNEVSADPDLTARVKLKGTIIAGVMDIRGTADVLGTMLMTFRPIPGEGPLHYNGQPEAFNTTLGYFGTLDGDGEGALPGDSGFSGFGEIRLRYDPDAKLPDGIMWPASIDPVADSYREGGRA